MLLKIALVFVGFMAGLFVFSLLSIAKRSDECMDIEDDLSQ